MGFIAGCSRTLSTHSSCCCLQMHLNPRHRARWHLMCRYRKFSQAYGCLQSERRQPACLLSSRFPVCAGAPGFAWKPGQQIYVD